MPEQEREQVVRREITKSPTFISLYANDVQVHTSPWDVRLLLGSVGELPTADHPVVNITQLADLRMSPQLAKRLVAIMIEQIKVYEERFGPIPDIPG